MVSLFGRPLSGGARDSSHRPRCWRIFSMTPVWSIKLLMRISPEYLGQTRGSVSHFFRASIIQNQPKFSNIFT